MAIDNITELTREIKKFHRHLADCRLLGVRCQNNFKLQAELQLASIILLTGSHDWQLNQGEHLGIPPRLHTSVAELRSSRARFE